MWVDRTGVKVGVTEQYSRNSKGSLALVAQVSAGLLGASPDMEVQHKAAPCLARLALLVQEACSLCKLQLPHAVHLPSSRRAILQEITTRDETGAPCARGMRTTPFGQYVADGPPTCLSGEPSPSCWTDRGQEHEG